MRNTIGMVRGRLLAKAPRPPSPPRRGSRPTKAQPIRAAYKLRSNRFAGSLTIGRSMRALRPSVQPSCLQGPAQNTTMRACASGSIGGDRHKNADPTLSIRLLRARFKRPCRRRATEQRDELVGVFIRSPRRRARAAFRRGWAEVHRGLEIDGQLDLFAVLDRQIGRFCPFENEAGVHPSTVIGLRHIGRVAH